MKPFRCPSCGREVYTLVMGSRSKVLICEDCYAKIDFSREGAPLVFYKWRYREALEKDWKDKSVDD